MVAKVATFIAAKDNNPICIQLREAVLDLANTGICLVHLRQCGEETDAVWMSVSETGRIFIYFPADRSHILDIIHIGMNGMTHRNNCREDSAFFDSL
jgi:hypothetical protein